MVTGGGGEHGAKRKWGFPAFKIREEGSEGSIFGRLSIPALSSAAGITERMACPGERR